MLEQRVTATADRFHTASSARVSEQLTSGFSAAFRHCRDGEVHLCHALPGHQMNCHSLDHVPDHWVKACDAGGQPIELLPEIEAGFMRGVEFWSLADLGCPEYDA